MCLSDVVAAVEFVEFVELVTVASVVDDVDIRESLVDDVPLLFELALSAAHEEVKNKESINLKNN